jgi:uncharacterized protein (TIGR00106 family)
MPAVIVAFSITPIGAGVSVVEEVADAVRIVRESGLPNETNAMFTNLEGEWDEVMGVIKACLDKVSEAAPRCSVVIKIDSWSGRGEGRMVEKVAALERRLS